MATPDAFLIDVYDTILTCDFRAHAIELPALAGIDPQSWNAAWAPLGPDLTEGRLSVAAAYEHVLEACGKEATPGLLAALRQRDRELLERWTYLYEDTAPFLRKIEGSGKRSCLVSNCSDTTRSQLEQLGVDRLVDAMVLSCEAGVSKPTPEIYLVALRELGVEPDKAVFVDDQARYCAGAHALGIRAFRMVRGNLGPGQVASGQVPSGEVPSGEAPFETICSFDELTSLI